MSFSTIHRTFILLAAMLTVFAASDLVHSSPRIEAAGDGTIRITLAEAARRGQILWRMVRPGGGRIILAPPTNDFNPEIPNRLFGMEYSYLFINIHNEHGERPIRFNPTTDKIVLEMNDGRRMPSLDLSWQARSIGPGLPSDNNSNFSSRFGDMRLMPGMNEHGILAFPSGADFSKVRRAYLRYRLFNSRGDRFYVEREFEAGGDSSDNSS